MSRARLALVGVAVILVAVTVVVVVIQTGSEPGIEREAAPSGSSQSETIDGAPSDSDLTEIESNLTSRDVEQVKKVLAIPEDVALEDDFLDAQQTWQELVIDRESFVSLGEDSGSVRAGLKLHDGSSAKWVLYLRRAADGWVIAATDEEA